MADFFLSLSLSFSLSASIQQQPGSPNFPLLSFFLAQKLSSVVPHRRADRHGNDRRRRSADIDFSLSPTAPSIHPPSFPPSLRPSSPPPPPPFTLTLPTSPQPLRVFCGLQQRNRCIGEDEERESVRGAARLRGCVEGTREHLHASDPQRGVSGNEFSFRFFFCVVFPYTKLQLCLFALLETHREGNFALKRHVETHLMIETRPCSAVVPKSGNPDHPVAELV